LSKPRYSHFRSRPAIQPRGNNPKIETLKNLKKIKNKVIFSISIIFLISHYPIFLEFPNPEIANLRLLRREVQEP
jgi:hypothetical protein